MPKQQTTSRALISGVAVAALVGASILFTGPAANAGQIVSTQYDSASQTDFLVPIGVTSVDYRVVGGPGGDASGEHGGLGGDPFAIEGTLAVTAGDTLNIWAGQAGGNGGGTGGPAGAGGAGFSSGGNGATSGNSARPGAGGGGSSAVALNGGVPFVIAAGGGGGGGRGFDEGVLPACTGGAGGDAGVAGSASAGPVIKCTSQTGGTTGGSSALGGVSATNVPQPVVINVLLGGSGGGGAGSGGAGSLISGFVLRTAGGGGGGGGTSNVPGDATSSAVEEISGNGFVVITYEISYETATTAVAAPDPSVIGQSVTLTATVTNNTTSDDPTGTVDFGVTGCDAQPLSAGVAGDAIATATCNWTAGPVGPATLPISYTPTIGSAFEPSGVDLEVEVEKGDTTTNLVIDPNPVTVGQSTTATATVSIDAPAVTPLSGNVQFYKDGVLFGAPVAVDPVSGEASINVPGPAAGTFNIEAFYLGSATLNPSDDDADMIVDPGDTTTVLTLDPNPAVTGGTVKATAKVTIDEPADAPLSGFVDFYKDGVYIDSAPVNPVTGIAVLEFPAGNVGTYEITAEYTGNDDLNSSEDSVDLVVQPKPLANTGLDASGLLLPVGGGALVLLMLGGVLLITRRAKA